MGTHEIEDETSATAPVDDGEAVPVCEFCLEPVPRDYALFCPRCGAPIDPLAAYLPYERIHAQGYLFRQAVARPRKLITVVGIWIIFLVPAVMLATAFLSLTLSNPAELAALTLTDYLVFGVILAIYFAISFRVTRGYFIARKGRGDSGGGNGNGEGLSEEKFADTH